MFVQQTLVIVKPDGMSKGLVGQILCSLREYGLRVVALARTQLSRQWTESLYAPERNEIYFIEVVEWVSSAPVLLLKVEGDQAVEKVKWCIIGRYPSGIRGFYAENWIQNVAHAPDSISSAARELKLAEPIFQESAERESARFQEKMIFALTGMSECGKSTAGEILGSMGVRRLKIVKLFEKVRDRWSPNQELYAFLREQEKRDPYALWDAFIDQLAEAFTDFSVDAISIESLYGGGLGPYLKQRLGASFCLVFIEVSRNIRLRRQMHREGLANLEDAAKYLLPRDKVKQESGIEALKEIADEVIDNSGTVQELRQAISALRNRVSVFRNGRGFAG
jgi:nucleoside-diphosphate kinase